MGGAAARRDGVPGPLPILAQTPAVDAPSPHVLPPSPYDGIQSVGRHPTDRLTGGLVSTATADTLRSLRCDRRFRGRRRWERLASTNHRTVFLLKESDYLRRGPLPAR